jgi:hypothetical protein
MTLTSKQEAWLHAKRGEPYTYPKPTPEEERLEREMAAWNARVGLWDARRALQRAKTDQDRERIQKTIKIYEEMLERNKEPEEPGEGHDTRGTKAANRIRQESQKLAGGA